MPAIVLYGPNGLPLNPSTGLIVDPTFAAARASIKPLEYAYPGVSFGHYRAAGITVALAPAASSLISALRFAPASNNPLAVMLRIRASLTVVTAVTAQRLDALLAFIARGYTVRDLTNATALVLSGNNAKLRTAMATPLAAIDMSNLAAGLTGGTKALDANPIGSMGLSGSSAVAGLGTGVGPYDLYKWDSLGEHPVVLVPNEGVVVQWGATALATGTITMLVEYTWAEALAF